jgi:hypothetical protein
VDYLITPALGGADDIHNLWPQSYKATVWNAEVKDALEDHLRNLVCGGELDLATAQREIATNWIEAYKKYFHTDRPLASTSRTLSLVVVKGALFTAAAPDPIWAGALVLTPISDEESKD